MYALLSLEMLSEIDAGPYTLSRGMTQNIIIMLMQAAMV